METDEELRNAPLVTDLGEIESCKADEDHNFDSNDPSKFEDPLGEEEAAEDPLGEEEAAKNESEFTVEEECEMLQSIIKKRLKWYEIVYEPKSKKRIRTKDAYDQILQSARKSSKFLDEQTRSIHADNPQPAAIDAMVEDFQPFSESIQLDRNETLVCQTNMADEMARVFKEESKVDILYRLQLKKQEIMRRQMNNDK